MLLPLTLNLGADGGEAAAGEEAVKTGTGGIDQSGRGRRSIVKPTGLQGTLHAPKKSPTPIERVEDSRAIQAEVAARLAREFGEDNAATVERERIELSRAQVDAEIGKLLRKKIRTEEDEIILLMLMAAAVA